MVGQVITAVCDDIEGDKAILRSEYNSPNVDTDIICEAIDGIEQGQFYQVEIIGYTDYDLVGAIKGENV